MVAQEESGTPFTKNASSSLPTFDSILHQKCLVYIYKYPSSHIQAPSYFQNQYPLASSPRGTVYLQENRSKKETYTGP